MDAMIPYATISYLKNAKQGGTSVSCSLITVFEHDICRGVHGEVGNNIPEKSHIAVDNKRKNALLYLVNQIRNQN